MLDFMSGSPGLVVTGGDSWSEGHGLVSRHRILKGDFSRLFVVKMFVWKKRIDAGDGPFLKLDFINKV